MTAVDMRFADGHARHHKFAGTPRDIDREAFFWAWERTPKCLDSPLGSGEHTLRAKAGAGEGPRRAGGKRRSCWRLSKTSRSIF